MKDDRPGGDGGRTAAAASVVLPAQGETFLVHMKCSRNTNYIGHHQCQQC